MTHRGPAPSTSPDPSPSAAVSPNPSPTPSPTLAELLVPAPGPTESSAHVCVYEPDEAPGIALGSWPDWIAAIGTSLAFVIAAVTYFRSTRDARAAQARLVYGKITEIRFFKTGEELPLFGASGAEIGTGEGQEFRVGRAPLATQAVIHVVVRVHNGSNELMGPVKVQLWDIGLRKPMERVTLTLDQIEPGSDDIGEMTVINEHAPAGEPGVGLVLVYRDSSRRWWKRQEMEPIERIHEDPQTMAETADQRAQRANVAKAFGLGAIEPLPRITPAVRWHRFWRRMRGKQPVP